MEKQLEGIKAILACPTYGPVDQNCQRDLRLGIMVAANNGIEWIGDASTDRYGYAMARNSIAQSVLDTDVDGVMWIDSDIRQKPSDISMLIAASKKYNQEFVTGVYHQREPIHTPVFYHFNKEKQRFQPYEDYPEGVFMPIGGCGFGFVWTGRGLIEKIAKSEEFRQEEGWFADRRDSGGFGEDLNFCYLAIKAGAQLYVHTGVQLGHSGDPVVIYREDFLREGAKYREAIAKNPEFRFQQKKKWGMIE